MLGALLFAAALTGQAAPAAPDLSSTPSPDCGGLRGTVTDGAAMNCVTAPLGRISYLALTYVAEAQRHGWTRLRGSNTVLWMQKPDSVETCEQMIVNVFWDSANTPVPENTTPAYLGIITKPGQPCQTVPSAPSPTAQ